VARILVIDDEALIRGSLRLALESAGHEVLEAADGAAGLRFLDGPPVDLVLCDVFMPRKDGLETIQELRRLTPRLPVIAMSGGSPAVPMDFLPLARRFGATRTLRKPFGVAEVLGAVREVLAGSRE
jgi:DNA-binding response OmpR family regulator